MRGAASEVYNCRCSMRMVTNYETAVTYQQKAEDTFGEWLVRKQEVQTHRFIPKTAGNAGTSFTSGVYSGIISDINGRQNITVEPITQESIDAVPLVIPNGFGKEFGAALQNAHKDLLRQMKDIGENYEGAFAMTLDGTVVASELGTKEQGRVDIPNANGKLYVGIHNHPDGLVFSFSDILGFAKRDEMVGLTAVGNNGSVYMMIKSNTYDENGFSDYIQTARKMLTDLANNSDIDGYISTVYRVLKGAKQYGVEFNERTL